MRSLMARGDPRVAKFPLMDNPIPVTLICMGYAVTMKKVGPYLMRNHRPLDLRNVMIVYNLLMVFLSSLVVYNELFYHWLDGSSLACDPVDYSDSPRAMRMVYTSYFYFILKFVEFFDTLFFVLRKKNTQITNLHVIHHGLLPFSVWWGLKFVPGGHATFFGFVNSIVHMIMYTYYGLAAIGPHMQKYLWWKRYLTMMQLAQFVVIGLHSFQLFFRSCNFPKIFGLWIGSHGILFWFLFTDFYKRAYSTYKSSPSAISSKSNKMHSKVASTPYSDANGNINKVN